METIEFLIILFNVLSVYYASKNSILTWSYGAFAAILTTYLFATDKMYASMLFNAYSAIMCAIGFFKWNSNAKENDKALINDSLLTTTLYFLIVICVVWLFTQYCGGSNPIYDTLGTSASIVGTFLMVRKDINCWYFWILCDIAYINYAIYICDYKYLFIYGTMLLLAIYGMIRNFKIYQINYEKKFGKI